MLDEHVVIEADVKVLSNVKIGKPSITAAKSVFTKGIPEKFAAVAVPAKLVTWPDIL